MTVGSSRRLPLACVVFLCLWALPGCACSPSMSHFESTRRWLKEARLTDAEVFLMDKPLHEGQKPDLVIRDAGFLERVRVAIIQDSAYCGYDPCSMPPGCAYAFGGDGHAAQIYLNFTRPATSLDSGRDSIILNVHATRFSFFGYAFNQDSFTSDRLATLLLDFLESEPGFDGVREALRFQLDHKKAVE